ncbi:dachshund homolog 2 [Sorex fumeus]|uniref:dachshund homolog 2 n=1 Tax=Sorex fumeus TaxID=62283 RepID=UPI0024ADCED4|nr:dachshund homolog 2 [Sorex fumeus]
MADPAPRVIPATSSGVPEGLFRAEPLYPSMEAPYLTSSVINNFMASSLSCSSGGGEVAGGCSGGGSANGECRMVDMRGMKVASFLMDGEELICLPQVFELFLKHLVGGLHTVYTKLKRLDITPVVCTVEQVRILRSLGAIQPGVNRCKLITRRDFETLFNDCANTSLKSGRLPKHSLGMSQDNAYLLPHSVPNLLSPDLTTQTGGSESSWDKNMIQPTLDVHGIQHEISHASMIGQTDIGDAPIPNQLSQNTLLNNRLELPFLMMPHPLLPVSLPPASVAMAMNQMNHLNTIANMAAAGQTHSPHSRAEASAVKEQMAESPSLDHSLEEVQYPVSQTYSQSSSSESSSPSQVDHHSERMEEVPVNVPMMRSHLENIQLTSGQALPQGFPGPFIYADNFSSVETLLMNVQGLLKVALDNTRIQEKQFQQEKKELRMELFREREIRENLERQLTVELQNKNTMQKRLKKEKRAKRKLLEALEFESKRREQVEQVLKQNTTADSSLSILDDTGIQNVDVESTGIPHDTTAMEGHIPQCFRLAPGCALSSPYGLPGIKPGK